MNSRVLAALREAIHSREPVTGFTHDLYRHPARFSPLFARAAIEAFSAPGDVVFDPFVGGGTTLVEARALGRVAIGADISALSAFVTRMKAGLLTSQHVALLQEWAGKLLPLLKLTRQASVDVSWEKGGYLDNLGGRDTWAVRQLITLALDSLEKVRSRRVESVARASILKTSQWALDCRVATPTVSEFRRHLIATIDHVIAAHQSYRRAVLRTAREMNGGIPRLLVMHRSTEGIEDDSRLRRYTPPRLVVTSPPYPGVHVVYHRWQIHGRRETAAPFWIANSLDGNGGSFYTFGDRKEPDLSRYFSQAQKSFSSVAKIIDRESLVVQLVAFNDPKWQLAAYLNAMREAGFRETKYPSLANARDGRAWREVPNRKWYARTRGAIPPSREVVLFHRRRD